MTATIDVITSITTIIIVNMITSPAARLAASGTPDPNRDARLVVRLDQKELVII